MTPKLAAYIAKQPLAIRREMENYFLARDFWSAEDCDGFVVRMGSVPPQTKVITPGGSFAPGYFETFVLWRCMALAPVTKNKVAFPVLEIGQARRRRLEAIEHRGAAPALLLHDTAREFYVEQVGAAISLV